LDKNRLDIFSDGLIELKPGWFIRPFPGELFIGGLPFYRHDPVSPFLIAAAVATATTGGIAAYQSYQQGKDAEKLSEQRAQADMLAAEQAEEEAAEEARIEEEKGQKLLARQKVLFAASGVRSNVGAPVVIEAETRRDIQIQKGFIMKRGSNAADNYRLNAAYELAYGKQQKKAGKWGALITALSTGYQAGSMGYQAGFFGSGSGGSVGSGSNYKWGSQLGGMKI
jgi:hypothetical protein